MQPKATKTRGKQVDRQANPLACLTIKTTTATGCGPILPFRGVAAASHGQLQAADVATAAKGVATAAEALVVEATDVSSGCGRNCGRNCGRRSIERPQARRCCGGQECGCRNPGTGRAKVAVAAIETVAVDGGHSCDRGCLSTPMPWWLKM